MYMMKFISNAYDTPPGNCGEGKPNQDVNHFNCQKTQMKLEFNFLIQVKSSLHSLTWILKKPLTNAKQVSGNLNLIMSIS